MSREGVKVVIVVLVGLPSSGKTSFCDRLKDYWKENRLGINLFHICFDNLFKIDQSVIDNGHFKTFRGNLLELVKVLVKGIHLGEYLVVENYLKENHAVNINEISAGFDTSNRISYVFIDDNNYYRSMRYPFYQLARETLSSFCQIYFGVDSSTAIRRDKTRTNTVGAEIIQKMALRLEKPVISNTWERKSYFIEAEKLEFNKILTFLEDVSACPEEPMKEKAQDLSLPQSEVHKIDLVLRSAIHRRVQQVESGIKALTASILQEKRKSILQDIRDGIIHITTYNITDFEDMLHSDPIKTIKSSD